MLNQSIKHGTLRNFSKYLTFQQTENVFSRGQQLVIASIPISDIFWQTFRFNDSKLRRESKHQKCLKLLGQNHIQSILYIIKNKKDICYFIFNKYEMCVFNISCKFKVNLLHMAISRLHEEAINSLKIKFRHGGTKTQLKIN